MSADELRRAAETLRGLASAATPTPWRFTDSEVVDDVFDAGLVVVGPHRDPIALVADQWYEDEEGEPTPWHDATYITTVHPGVGLALAELFTELAAVLEAGSNPDVPIARLTTDVARIINGGVS